MSICVQLFVWTYFHFSWVFPLAWNCCIMWNCQCFFQSGCTVLYSLSAPYKGSNFRLTVNGVINLINTACFLWVEILLGAGNMAVNMLMSVLPLKTIQLSVERQVITKSINRIISEHDKYYEVLTGVGWHLRNSSVGKVLWEREMYE